MTGVRVQVPASPRERQGLLFDRVPVFCFFAFHDAYVKLVAVKENAIHYRGNGCKMRIIDKNTDFYDYFQDIYRDASLTFDRTDSFLLTKEIMCRYLTADMNHLRFGRRQSGHEHCFLLLQVCHTFWLFLVDILAVDSYGAVADYAIKLLRQWKNYDKPRILIALDVISFGWDVRAQLSSKNGYWHSDHDLDKMQNRLDVLQNAVDLNNHRVSRRIDRQMVSYGGDNRVEKHIPLLKACGIAPCVDALDVFLSFEEYFSLEKTAAERTDAIGTTNADKIESHGFDVKSSFRGKRC